MSETKNNLLLLFQKPLEPLFTKRDNGKLLDIPPEYYTPRFSRMIGNDKPMLEGRSLKDNKMDDDKVDMIQFEALQPEDYPDLLFASNISKDDPFSLFNQKNKKTAATLTQIFLEAPDVSKLFATAAYVRDRVNPILYHYALSVAIQHRLDTKDLDLPVIARMFPDKFVQPLAFRMCRQTLQLMNSNEVAGNKSKIYKIPLNLTASDNEVEQRVAYFREDLGINSHHWHWHSVYPGEGTLDIVNKDRRGELFYYMHNQLINRYNVERICNALESVKPLNDLRVVVPEAYFPKLIRSKTHRIFPARAANTMLSDINRSSEVVELADLERWSDRIYTAIDQGYVVDESGNPISLMGSEGVDILGNVIEATSLSPNRRFYGSLHEHGHTVISYMHDPDEKYLEETGVMGHFETAMRDPLFYRWHSFIDSMFARHKKNLGPYDPEKEFQYNGVTVSSVSVQTTKTDRNPKPKKNFLYTFWDTSYIELKSGLDFAPEGNIQALFTHLQHDPFDFQFSVRNNTKQQLIGTCRIFMCPKNGERGGAFKFEEQRKLMIEMDKFKVYLKPGLNYFKQASTESSVTISYDRSFGTKGGPIGNAETDTEKAERQAKTDFCGCGWPQHMLLPKGSSMGTKFDIFVMITNYVLDRVDQPDKKSECNGAASFCGLKDQKYPDKRPMGFPFDRPYRVDKLADFTNLGSNMAIGECVIKFKP